MDIKESLMNEKEAAAFLGVSRITLLRKRKNKEINFFRIGHRILYSREKHLLPFLDKCEQHTAIGK
ncbi:MAG TPA: helix-turn-helix domain-containing protein [Pyrinomonadaceae bacterium]